MKVIAFVLTLSATVLFHIMECQTLIFLFSGETISAVLRIAPRSKLASFVQKFMQRQPTCAEICAGVTNLCRNVCSGQPTCVGICAVAGQLVSEIVQSLASLSESMTGAYI
jgi:hypothetical protein